MRKLRPQRIKVNPVNPTLTARTGILNPGLGALCPVLSPARDSLLASSFSPPASSRNSLNLRDAPPYYNLHWALSPFYPLIPFREISQSLAGPDSKTFQAALTRPHSPHHCPLLWAISAISTTVSFPSAAPEALPHQSWSGDSCQRRVKWDWGLRDRACGFSRFPAHGR